MTKLSILTVSLAVFLAVMIGPRLESGSIQTAFGVLLGIAASVPISLGLIIALTRPRRATPRAPSFADLSREDGPPAARMTDYTEFGPWEIVIPASRDNSRWERKNLKEVEKWDKSQ